MSEQTIPTAIKQVAQNTPERIALQIPQGDAFRSYTYRELVTQFERGADQLKAAGLKPGDRIVLLAENTPEWAIACFSALQLGATVVPLDIDLSPNEIKTLIERADVRGLMLSNTQFQSFSSALPTDLPALNTEANFTPFEGHPNHLSTDRTPTSDPNPEIALLLFTSGTTGTPKGVLLNHTSLIHTSQNCVDAIEPDPNQEDQVISLLPLHHVTGLTATVLGPLLMGASVTFLETLSAESIVSTMQKTRTTVLPAVPRLYELFYTGICQKVAAKGKLAQTIFNTLNNLCAIIRRYTPWNPGPRLFGTVHNAFGGSLRVCCCGAAPLSPDVLQGFEKLGFDVIEAYGLTESAGVATAQPISKRKPGTVGFPASHTQIKIANPTPSTSEGEICIRGPVLMHGYFRDENATNEIIRDGWLHTGDLGKIDHEGHLIVTGRLKELIVTSGGKNASPVEVEQRYHSLPGVKELAVFGMPAQKGYGDDIHAAVVLDQDVSIQTVESAIAALAPEIPSHMRIQQLHTFDELPKTTTLKVKRSELQKVGSNGQISKTKTNDMSSWDDDTKRVIQIVAEVMRQTGETLAISLDATLQFELGIDSMGLIELTSRIEQAFEVHIDEHLLPTLYTVSDLANAIKTAQKQPRNTPTSLTEEGRTEPIQPPRGLFSRLTLQAFKRTVRLIWHIDVQGHMPKEGPVILCPNHESHIDIFLVASCLPSPLRRTLCCFAKQEHFEKLGTRIVAKLACAIPTDRDGDILPALRAGAKVLSDNRSLLIHPEGTRTRTGELRPFRGGAARLSLSTGVPLIPVRIVGAYKIFPAHRFLPRLFNWRKGRRHKLKIIFGAPIQPQAESQTETQLTEDLRHAIVDLAD